VDEAPIPSAIKNYALTFEMFTFSIRDESIGVDLQEYKLAHYPRKPYSFNYPVNSIFQIG